MTDALVEMLEHYDHAVYMQNWKQADYWWKAIEPLLGEVIK